MEMLASVARKGRRRDTGESSTSRSGNGMAEEPQSQRASSTPFAEYAEYAADPPPLSSPQLVYQPPLRDVPVFDQLVQSESGHPDAPVRGYTAARGSQARVPARPGELGRKQSSDSLASKSTKTKKKSPTKKHSNNDLQYDLAADEEGLTRQWREEEYDRQQDEEHLARMKWGDQLGGYPAGFMSWSGESVAVQEQQALTPDGDWIMSQVAGFNVGPESQNVAEPMQLPIQQAQQLMALDVPSLPSLVAASVPGYPGSVYSEQEWSMSGFEEQLMTTNADDSPLEPKDTALEEIRSEGPGAWAAFRKALDEGTQPLHTVKLCFVGHARAGKTSTLMSLAGRPFNPEEESTHGVATHTVSLTNQFLQKPGAVPSAPWSELEGTKSVGELLEHAVARTVAERLLEAQADAPDTPASSAPAAAHAPAETRQESLPPRLKMPVDLIAQAVAEESKSPESSPVVMQTWDFAGQEMYYNMAHVFLTALGIYVFVVDLSAWLDSELPSPSSELVDAIDFWLAAIFLHAPGAQLVIVGSHGDAVPEHSRQEVYERVDAYLRQRLDRMPSLHAGLNVNVQQQLLFFPVDNRRQTREGQASVDRLRAMLDDLALQIAERVRDIPTRWAHLFHVLSGRTAVAQDPWRPYVKLEECEGLAQDFGLAARDELEGFLKLFHDLGQLLHFPGSPAIVLDPQWLLDAMAQVVGCPRVLQQRSHLLTKLRDRGELSRELLYELWHDVRFQSHSSILQAFLEHFDFLVPGVDGHWLVPSLLPRSGCRAIHNRDQAECKCCTTLLLDFHGVLHSLLPSLLPRLLSHFRRLDEGGRLRVFSVHRDCVSFSLTPKVRVTLEMHPRAVPEIMCATLHTPDGRVSSSARELILKAFRDALTAWLPALVFSVKLPCPCCTQSCVPHCNALACGRWGHFLELADALSDEVLFCTETEEYIEEGALPGYLQEWRRAERPQQSPPQAAAQASGPQAALKFLYASPIMEPPLDVAAEVHALESIGGFAMEIRLATSESLQQVLLSSLDNAVLHISAHCITGPSYPTSYLVLEDMYSQSHPLSEDALAKLGPWKRVRLLVLLACGSQALVRGLILHHGLPCAVCCSGQVFDTAARLFCKTFYLALSEGHTIAESHKYAQARVRCSPNIGIQAEADKFVLLRAQEEHAERVLFPRGGGEPLRGPVHRPWLVAKRVEDYTGRAEEAVRVAEALSKRRVVRLHGVPGIGKSAFCREFSNHYSAPGGRLFAQRSLMLACGDVFLDRVDAAAAAQEELATALLSKISGNGLLSEEALAEFGGRPWDALTAAASRIDNQGLRWLLVVDGLHSDVAGDQTANEKHRARLAEEHMAKALKGLLGSTSHLCLLLTSTSQSSPCWAAVDASEFKVIDFELRKLSKRDSARLLARRTRRPLYPADFDCSTRGRDAAGEPLPLGAVIDRLVSHPLMDRLDGVPGKIVKAAVGVDDSLESLMSHPLCPAVATGVTDGQTSGASVT